MRCKMENITWKETSNFTSSKVNEPTECTTNLEEITIRVHRPTDFRNSWLLSCKDLGLIDFELQETDIGKAKSEALEKTLIIVKSKIKQLKVVRHQIWSAKK